MTKNRWRGAAVPVLLLLFGFAAAYGIESALRTTGLLDWFAMRHLHYVPILIESLVVLAPIGIASVDLELVDLFVRTGFASLGVYIALVFSRFDFRMFVPSGETVESTMIFTVAILFVSFFAYAGIVMSFIALPSYLLAGRLVGRPAKPSGLFDYAHMNAREAVQEPFAQGRARDEGVH